MVSVLVVSLSILALVSFVVLLAALRSGASDPGFRAGSTDKQPPTDDDDDPAT